MSYHYEFDGRNRILLAVADGRIDDSEMRELYFAIRKRKEEVDALTGILDLTGVTVFDVSSQTIRELAHHPPNFDDPTLRAVVAPTDLMYGMARMFQTEGSYTREQLHIVRALDEALTLLGAVVPQFKRWDAA
jgi:hypothetical protein